MEIIEAKVLNIESELDYVKNVKDKNIKLESIPLRIATRYRENFMYIVNHLKSLLPNPERDDSYHA